MILTDMSLSGPSKFSRSITLLWVKSIGGSLLKHTLILKIDRQMKQIILTKTATKEVDTAKKTIKRKRAGPSNDKVNDEKRI